MEYNPHIYSSYVESHHTNENVKLSNKELKQYGKFERKYVKTGWTDHRSALAVFLVAAVLETKHKQLMKEAKGLDDVVNVLSLSLSTSTYVYIHTCPHTHTNICTLAYYRFLIVVAFYMHALPIPATEPPLIWSSFRSWVK